MCIVAIHAYALDSADGFFVEGSTCALDLPVFGLFIIRWVVLCAVQCCAPGVCVRAHTLELTSGAAIIRGVGSREYTCS